LGRRYGRLGLEMALAFVAVALVAVAATVVVASVVVFPGIHHLITSQEEHTAKGAAIAAAAIYRPVGWAARLAPEVVLIDMSGSRLQCRNAHGQVVRSSPGYVSFAGPALTQRVVVDGQYVGSVTVKFGANGIAGVEQLYRRRLLEMFLISGIFAVIFALLVSVVLASLIAAPVDLVVRAARARSAGQRQARVGAVRGLRDLRKLAATFDQMAASLGRDDQLRRNAVAYIVHDLRTPIAVLRAGMEAMLDGVSPITPASVASLHAEVMRLGQMVEGLRLMSVAEAAALQLRMTHSDLAAVAADTADSLASIFDAAGVRLVRQLSTVPVRCDEARMRQVITNLLTNAAKFTPEGGEVTIQTRPSGQSAVVRVSDTGPGIPAEELPHLTERFYRGRGAERTSGSGIGLAIVEELVRAHHGTIDIASQLGEGTQITIEIPRGL
jgi:two-component system sensor histidine kinase BaeS